MDSIKADGTFGHWIGDFEKIDEGRSTVLMENAGQQTELFIRHCMLDSPPPSVAHVSHGWIVEYFHCGSDDCRHQNEGYNRCII